MSREVWRGRPFPLGATWDGAGTNFSLYSEHGQRVELCLFHEEGAALREERIALAEQTAHVWHVYLPGVGPGQRYGYRVHGPYAPSAGQRFNPAKLLIDPYAQAIDAAVDWGAARVLPYAQDGDDSHPDPEDDAAAIPKCVVVDGAFDWEGDRRPDTPWNETVIYEAHVKGLTRLHPLVPEALRGTYRGLAHDAVLAYLRDLGVTAIELLPIHHIADEHFLHERGLTNYWGYSSIGYLAPHAGYAASSSTSGCRGEQVREFKELVRALHRAGIEVILDVVYNHTAEGDHLGPLLSFRGIDNAAYYRLRPDDPSKYVDFTGTGNSLNPKQPNVLRLIMDSLRYWVTECHVDGFRFDLASALARELYEVNRLSTFFEVIHQDPVLSQVKLIAEPWDVGPGGYQVGHFPVLWSEWNGVFRDSVRDFWRGRGALADFATRLSGSQDLYGDDGRRPFASINFVTAHDGYTLADLVAYERKHNEANGEGNRDGSDDNRSWNCGVEGDTDDPAIVALRRRQQRNLLATLLLSQGVPMLLAGDELGRTQRGNNNAWCQDNEVSWLDWSLLDTEPGRALHDFTRRLLALRRAHPVFRRRNFLQGRRDGDDRLPDAWWFRPDGEEMSVADWCDEQRRVVGLFLNGERFIARDERGQPLRDDSFLLLFNAQPDEVRFVLPAPRFGARWALELSTAEPERSADVHEADAALRVEARSVVVLRRLAETA